VTGQSFAAVVRPISAGQSFFYRAVALSGGHEVWQDSPGAFSTPVAWVKTAAHRGGALLAPENTVAAFLNAQGLADLVEFDVRESKDGRLVVMHDETVNRTTDGSGAVSNMTLTALKTLDAGRRFSRRYAGERIPTLDEALAAILPDTTPLIDRKAGTAEQFVAQLQSLGVTRQVIISSDDTTFLYKVHGLDPAIRLGAIGTGAALAAAAASLKSKGIDFALADNLQTDHIQKLHACGMQAYVWTVNAMTQMQFFVATPVDGIISDNPLLATQIGQQDMDGDGLVDAWEGHYWGGLALVNGTGDTDGDGLADWAEFGAGTDPRDPGSRLALQWSASARAGEMTVGWSSRPGRFYSLQTCPTPNGPWTAVASHLTPSSPMNVCTVRTDGAQAFYRVRVER